MGSRQSEIIRAAARVFKAKGYHAATIQDIADEVGLLKGSLYHYVASKEELLYLVVKDPITRLYRRLEKIADGKGSASERPGHRGPPGGLRRALISSLALSSTASW